jgi:hypothetical protein
LWRRHLDGRQWLAGLLRQGRWHVDGDERCESGGCQ